jgi:DNA processing protein
MQVIEWGDAAYPPLLACAPDPPKRLWLRGHLDALTQPQVAIVGARHASIGGIDNARLFARALVGCGITVTSGLALGIDGAAHRAALDAGGRSIAVIGSGLSQIYPRSHLGLADALAETGAVISEYAPAVTPRQHHFPQRNRIIAGISVAVIVIEASERSGSLITARLAAEAGREVFALPGSIHHPLARGCHVLIRQGAQLALDVADVLDGVRGCIARHQDMLSPLNAQQGEATPALDAIEDHPLLGHLESPGATLDTLAERLSLTIPELSATLTALELDGRVQHSGGRYVRVRENDERRSSGRPAVPV